MKPASATSRTVLVALHEEELSGASLSVLRLRELLAERGWDLVFWAPRPSALYDSLVEMGIDVSGANRTLVGYSAAALRVPPGPVSRLSAVPGYARELYRAIDEKRPVLVHANSMYAPLEAAVARMHRVPVVFHVHEMIRDNLKGRVARRIVHRLGSEVVAVSAACREALAQDGCEVRLVHEAAPLPPRPHPRPERDLLTAGTVGVVSRRKGSDLFIAAARIAQERGLPVRFEMVGSSTAAPLDRDWSAMLLEEAAALGVVHRDSDDVGEAMLRWDVFVHPAREDPFPIVVLEAMGYELPIVGAGVDGVAEQLAEGAGILVSPDDPVAIADALDRLCNDNELRLRLGAKARERVAANWTLEAQADGLAAAYEACLNSR